MIISKPKQLMELATQDIIAELVNVKNVAVTDAINIFYGSEFCQKLYDESTGLHIFCTFSAFLLENC